MKLLIINNGTSYLPQLKSLLANHNCQVIKYTEIDTINTKDYDATILSGGHDFTVNGNEDRLSMEFDLVINSTKPILGICFGFEIIARAFGSTLVSLPSKEQGIIEIEVVEPNEIFLNIPNFKVFENHRWVIKDATKEISILARSKDGIEAFKHKTKPIYAVQFHPEMFVEKSCGAEIVDNFLNLVK